ncbi:Ig-like domain-containing protein [Reichenbachiella sp.]|uniref:Ig-like domain-containing protein n=1 Tax=Reichenbachiella sp. TaxID=2184521 RepID=UPI003BAFA225
MKQLKRLLTSTFLASALLFACTEDEPEVDITDIKFDGEKVIVTEGFTVDLDTVLVITGSDADQAQISFSSGDETIFSVDGFILTAVKAGTTTVTAIEANTELTASIPVEVIAKTVAVTGVSLDKETADMKVGDELQLTATVAPEDATEKGVTWSVASSSDSKNKEDSPTDIATVSDEGLVKAIAAGDVVVTVKTKDGEFTASIDISVSNVAVTGVALGPDPIEVNVNEYVQLTTSVSPENATNQNVTWSLVLEETEEAGRTNNEIVIVLPPTADDYAEIDENGKLKGKLECDGCGLMAVVTTEEGEFTDKLPVKINYIPVTSITINPNTYFTIDKGETFQMEYTIEPEDATNQEIEWEITYYDNCRAAAAAPNPDDYATVDENGKITAIDAHSCGLQLSASVSDLRSPATVDFNVLVQVESLSILDPAGSPIESTYDVECGQTDFGYSYEPGSASDSDVIWSIDNDTHFSIDQNGVLDADITLPSGIYTTKLTITAQDGSGVKKEITITYDRNNCI